MAKTVDALKALYEALGGEEELTTNKTVDVLNAIAEQIEGEGGAHLTAEAIANIAAAIEEGGDNGGDDEPIT